MSEDIIGDLGMAGGYRSMTPKRYLKKIEGSEVVGFHKDHKSY